MRTLSKATLQTASLLLAIALLAPAAGAVELSGPQPAAPSPVAITDDAGGAPLFADLPLLRPGDRVSRCISVTYQGTLPAEIVLYSEVGGTGLARHLQMDVEVGRGGGFGDCTGFASEATLFSGLLEEMGGLAVRVWSAQSGMETRTFRFTATLADDDRAQGTSASASFIWEARGG